jgi:tRNA nucleotidyltransferase/poly(A) polymerase
MVPDVYTPMDQHEAATNAERLVSESHYALEEGRPELATRLLLEAQVYATLSNRPYYPR